ncbi:MAG: hypothetical protein RLY49_201 [Candidatus Parcubacteria bacterium]|jgi:hypothetical protein
MKQLIFSLILLMFLSPVVFAQPATQDELLDYIKNGPKVTPAEWTKPPSADLEKYLEDIANKQNGSQDSNQFRAGESAADYIHRVNIQNKIAETLGYTESVQPDPTVSTTQVPPNNGQAPAPFLSETQKPDINNYMTNPMVPAPTEIKTLNDIVSPTLFQGTPLNKVLNQLFYIGLVAAIILAIVMIIKGGIEYMTVDSITSKESGKKRVQAALGGLVLAFSAILILNTVNPGLTSLSLQFEQLQGITGVNFGGLTNGYRTLDPQTGVVTAKMSDEELKAYTLQKIKEMGFSQLSPADKAAFFPNGGTDEEWLGLVSAMMKYESGFDPNTTYPEKNSDGTPRLNNKGEQIVSTGLLQLSYESVNGYGFNVTTDQLKDSKTNIDVGLTILKKWISEDGYISGPNDTGGARYWSVLRSSGKLQDVRNEMVR